MDAPPRPRIRAVRFADPSQSGLAGARREAELMRLLPLWPHEVADASPAGRKRLITLLRRALRAERKRGLSGHWTYDLSRHTQLLALYRAECAAQRVPFDANS